MDLTIYDIIQGPILSEKSQKLSTVHKQIFLQVHPKANKPLIKQALEQLFNVKVKDVRVQVRKGKNRMVRRRQVTGSDQKRAYITLAEGYALDLFEQAKSAAQPAEPTAKV